MNLISEDSPPPHGERIHVQMMGAVCLALVVPTPIAATWLYGLGAPLLVLVCIATALVSEHPVLPPSCTAKSHGGRYVLRGHRHAVFAFHPAR